MNKSKLRSDFDRLLNEIDDLKNHDDFYTYEKEFVEIYEKFGKAIFMESLGRPTQDRRKKKG